MEKQNKESPCSSERLSYEQCLRQDKIIICGKVCVYEKLKYYECQEKQKLIEKCKCLKYKHPFPRE